MPSAPLATAADLPRPITELHLHLEGTLEPETIFALADRHGLDLPHRDLDDLRGKYEFADLQSFLDLYYANMAVLRTSADFATLTWSYARRAARRASATPRSSSTPRPTPCAASPAPPSSAGSRPACVAPRRSSA